MRIAVIYCLDDEHCGFSRATRRPRVSFSKSNGQREGNIRVGLLLVDTLCDFDVKGIVVLWLRGSSGTSDEKLKLGCFLPISRGIVPHSVGQERRI